METKEQRLSKGLADHQQKKREKTLARIDNAIRRMREENTTITKKSLAEELEMSERALYSEYIKRHLHKYKEFNPALEDEPISTINAEELMREINHLRLRIRELTVKNKELESEIKKSRADYAELSQRYERILGEYQSIMGSKIVPR